jgi:hypothetical protein
MKMQYSMTAKGGIFRGRDEIDRIAGGGISFAFSGRDVTKSKVQTIIV